MITHTWGQVSPEKPTFRKNIPNLKLTSIVLLRSLLIILTLLLIILPAGLLVLWALPHVSPLIIPSTLIVYCIISRIPILSLLYLSLLLFRSVVILIQPTEFIPLALILDVLSWSGRLRALLFLVHIIRCVSTWSPVCGDMKLSLSFAITST